MTAAVAVPAPTRAGARAEVALAARILPAVWPLETFIAVNPLGNLEHLPFGEALAIAADAYGAAGTLDEPAFRALHAAGRITERDLRTAIARRHAEALEAPGITWTGGRLAPLGLLLADFLHGAPAPRARRRLATRSEREAPAVAALVDHHTATWCGAFLDAGHAAWTMPGRERGLYRAWRDLAHRDRSLPRATRRRLTRLPGDPEDALLEALAELEIAPEAWRRYLEAHLTALPGWAALVQRHGGTATTGGLVDLLALRLSYETALLATVEPGERSDRPPAERRDPGERALRALAAAGIHDPGPASVASAEAILARVAVGDRALTWLEAYETHYRDGLLARLGSSAPVEVTHRPAAQLVACIDVRSEGLRRHLEETGDYETFGFAGFFAVAIRFRTLAAGDPTAQCPVLIQPRHDVDERPLPGAEQLAARQLAGQHVLASAHEAAAATRHDLLTPFALAEATGLPAGAIAAAKTVLTRPYGAARRHLARVAAPPAPTELDVDHAFSAAERALFAEAALSMMGLTRSFARLVVLCGHGSTTENNPYASALDCGACGGNRGGPNARAAAAILNRRDVRLDLRERGISIPDDTWFVAAEHDTATDRVTFLDPHLVPATHQGDLARLGDDLAEATTRLSAERCSTLPGAPASPSPARAQRHVATRSADWAQVFPEWGLAGNAALVVGPRSLTRGVDLGRRVFLHSYDARTDPDGTALETILTAPLVVAQWISCQYYFSAVAPDVFGAGTKTIHNVVGDIGVLSGHGGDVRIGLPWQSVAVDGALVHEPMRLLAVVEAPLERIDAIISRNTVLQHLFGNEWVALVARSRHDEPWLRLGRGGWTPWTDVEGGTNAPR